MFIIASSGRSGTLALCQGLSQFSDHRVLHEPEPRLLEEAFLKHSGQPYETAVLRERLVYFRARSAEKYGESFRAPNLLGEIARAVPQTRFLILVRDPLEYVISAHSKNVFRKNDEFDRTRIVPRELGDEFAFLSLAERIAWHWVALNTYLLEFAESDPAPVRVVIAADLDQQADEMIDHLGVRVTDRQGLRLFLNSRPNSKQSSDMPDGFDPGKLSVITARVWKRAAEIARAKA